MSDKKQGFIGQLAQQTGLGAATGAVGMGLGWIDDALFGAKRRQQELDQRKKLSDLEKRKQLDLMGAQQRMQMEMWEKTNYPAQMAMMREAGLNPSLMYAGGGEGGVTGSGMPGGGLPESDEMRRKQASIAERQMGLDMMRQKAEIGLIEAQTDEIKEDTAQKEGIDKQLKEINLREAVERIDSERVKRLGYNLDNMMKEFENSIRGSRWKLEESKAEEYIKNMALEGVKIIKSIDYTTQDMAIKQEQRGPILEALKLQNQNLVMSLYEKQEGIHLTRAQINELQARTDNEILKPFWQKWELQLKAKGITLDEKQYNLALDRLLFDKDLGTRQQKINRNLGIARVATSIASIAGGLLISAGTFGTATPLGAGMVVGGLTGLSWQQTSSR